MNQPLPKDVTAATGDRRHAGAHIENKCRGHPLTALPIFLHSRFRHGFVFINNSKGIQAPSDLISRGI